MRTLAGYLVPTVKVSVEAPMPGEHLGKILRQLISHASRSYTILAMGGLLKASCLLWNRLLSDFPPDLLLYSFLLGVSGSADSRSIGGIRDSRRAASYKTVLYTQIMCSAVVRWTLRLLSSGRPIEKSREDYCRMQLSVALALTRPMKVQHELT